MHATQARCGGQTDECRDDKRFLLSLLCLTAALFEYNNNKKPKAGNLRIVVGYLPPVIVGLPHHELLAFFFFAERDTLRHDPTDYYQILEMFHVELGKMDQMSWVVGANKVLSYLKYLGSEWI